MLQTSGTEDGPVKPRMEDPRSTTANRGAMENYSSRDYRADVTSRPTRPSREAIRVRSFHRTHVWGPPPLASRILAWLRGLGS